MWRGNWQLRAQKNSLTTNLYIFSFSYGSNVLFYYSHNFSYFSLFKILFLLNEFILFFPISTVLFVYIAFFLCNWLCIFATLVFFSHCFFTFMGLFTGFEEFSKITADGDCSHEIKRRLLLGSKVMTNLNSILNSRDINLPTKVYLVKAMVFPVVMQGCESWTIRKVECQRIDAFELWCWRRLESPLDSKEIKPVNP